MRQWVDFYITFDVAYGHGACQCVDAINVHCTGAANALAAGAPEGQGWIDFIFDLDHGVQNHRPAIVQVDLVVIYARIVVVIRIPAIDTKCPGVASTFRCRKGLTLLYS